MQIKLRRYMLLTLLAITSAAGSTALAQTPASNLAGVKQIQERIDVTLNLSGADEFGVEAGEIVKIVRGALASAGVTVAKGNEKTPSVEVLITGESSGGGATFTVEIVVAALLPSPFAKDRSIQAIIWRASVEGKHLIRFDPAAKELVKPTGPMKERVYDSVREVAQRLAAALKAA
jgi:hypothetical protein